MITNLKKKLENKSKKSGFTLIELIIVIAIIAILVAIALPKFGEVRENANRKADMASAKDIQSAVISLINDDKITLPAAGSTIEKELKAGDDAAEYMQSIPEIKSNAVRDGQAKGSHFFYSINNKGDVRILNKSGGKEVYPNFDSTLE